VVEATEGRKLIPTIWFTGLPCAGKTTLAEAFAVNLREKAYQVVHLDGDVLRKGLCADLGFSDDDRTENLRRVANVAELLNRNNILVLASFISPTKVVREMIADIVTNVRFVYVQCSLEECKRRDVKGMYAKAEAGEIDGFTGVGAPYEKPEKFTLRVNTEVNDLDACIEQLMGGFVGSVAL